MWRYFVGGIAALLMAGAGVFLSQGKATPEPVPPPPPAPVQSEAAVVDDAVGEVPRATPKTREEKRFNRNDKDRNEIVTLAELTLPRRKAFAKLDKNGDGKLSFEEWAVRTTTRFAGADKDRSGGLSRTEFATTAPKRKAAVAARCNCREAVAKALADAE